MRADDVCHHAEYYMGTLWFIGLLLMLILIYPLLRLVLLRTQRVLGAEGLVGAAAAAYLIYLMCAVRSRSHL